MRSILTTSFAILALSGPAMAQAFDVVSVLPAQGGAGIDYRFYPNRFVGTYLTLEQLIGQAWAIDAREIAGGSDWIRVDRFNVTAIVESAASPAQMRTMLQACSRRRERAT
jgi:uncharacterized protein (TIGR03435 family)